MAAYPEKTTKNSMPPASNTQSKKNSKGIIHPLISTGFEEFNKRFPNYRNTSQQVEPYVHQFADFLDNLYPYLVKGVSQLSKLMKLAEERGLDEYAPLFLGLILCFFGGTYVTLIASYEAMRLSVWQRLTSSLKVLRENYVAAKEASDKDDLKDDNKDGIPDVQQQSSKQLLSRKVMVFMKASDPQQVSAALAALWSGFLVIVATVKMQFAQTITLGASLGEMFEERFGKSMESFATSILPPDLKKWGPTVCAWSVRIAAGLIALFIHRIIVAIHAAIRGATLFTNAAFKLAHDRQWLPPEIGSDSRQATIVSGVITFVGFYWQLTHAFGIPFPLNILFLPLTLAEWFLTIMVNVL